jgi:sialidase-1
MIRFSVLIAICLVAASAAAEPTVTQNGVIVAHVGEHGFVRHRNPMLIATRTAIVMFIEPKTGLGTDASLGIYAKRTTDKKNASIESWSKPYPVVPLATAQQASPLYDPKTGRIWLNYCVAPQTDAATCWITHSDDDGITWATPTDITSQVKAAGVGELIAGPNPGVLLPSGRMVFGRYQRPTGGSTPWIGCHYSDDGGVTWSYSTVDQSNPANSHAIEPALVQLPDGRLLMDCRNKSGHNSRRQTISTDGGTTWGNVTTYAIPGGECQASIITDGRHVGLCCPAATSLRGRLTFYGSRDNVFTARHRTTIHDSHAAYSSMCWLDGGRILIVYEAGDDVHVGVGSEQWAHDNRMAIIDDPFSGIESPNPETEFLSSMGGAAIYVSPFAEMFNDREGTQAIIRNGDGPAINALRDRGASGFLWSNASEGTGLRWERHETDGDALRFRADAVRASGGLLNDVGDNAAFVHQTGTFTVAARFAIENYALTQNHTLLDSCNLGSHANGLTVIACDYGQRLNVIVRAGGASRVSHRFVSLGAITTGGVYDLVLSCEGDGEPLKAWIKRRGAAMTTEVGANMGGTDNANASTNPLCIGNRMPGVYCPFDGWLMKLVVSRKAWGASEFDAWVSK